MTIKSMTRLLTALLLFGVASTVQAASIWLTPNFSGLAPGDSFDINIFANFDGDPTLGGGIDIAYSENQLDFLGYAASGIGDPAFQRDPDVLPHLLSGIAFGDFDGCPGPNCAPGGDNFLVGTLSFQVAADALDGFVFIAVSDTADPAVGPFVSAVTFQVQDVDFKGSKVSIKVIPLPAAVWLLAGALGTLVGLGRKRT